MPPVRLIHISDLHFGDANPATLTAALRAFDGIKPDCIVATGDITQAGRRSEFDAAAQWFSRVSSPVVACPGNHDAPVYAVLQRIATPFHRFNRLALGQQWRAPCGGVAVEAINSARPLQARLDWSQGSYHIGDLGDSITRLERDAPGGWRFLAVHHPPFTPKGAQVVSKTKHADRAMTQFGGVKKLLTLAGHVHGFFIEQDPITKLRFMTAPSLASSRERGHSAGFLALDVEEDFIDVTRWLYATDQGFAPSGAPVRLLA
ncbi:MAG: metallophosphoesterase [Caulobacterales bacterium]